MARQLPFHVVFPSAVTQTDMLHRRNSERRLISSWTAEPFLSEPKWMSYYQGISPTKISQISTWSACSDDHEKFVRCDKSTKIFTNFPRIREKRRKGGIQLAISYRRPQATVTSLITCHFWIVTTLTIVEIRVIRWIMKLSLTVLLKSMCKISVFQSPS